MTCPVCNGCDGFVRYGNRVYGFCRPHRTAWPDSAAAQITEEESRKVIAEIGFLSFRVSAEYSIWQ